MWVVISPNPPEMDSTPKFLPMTPRHADGCPGVDDGGRRSERAAIEAQLRQALDDEQYAVAMALMARKLNIPARVVMGFYPDWDEVEDPSAPIALTGEDDIRRVRTRGHLFGQHGGFIEG